MAATTEPNQVGKREDLADIISVADAKEKPFLAMVPKGKEITNMRFDWQADTYDNPQMSGVADGVDVGEFEDAAKDRRLISNYCQKVRRTAMVGDIAENVSNVAGAKSGELARALDKKTEEISRDIEAILCSDQDAQQELDKNTPYKTRALGAWLKATAGTVLPVPTQYLTPAAAINTTPIGNLSEDADVRPLLKTIFQNHGKSEDLTLLCGTDLKEAFTNFTRFKGADANTYGTIRSYNADLDGGKIINNITLYEGDFNKVKLVPSLLLARSLTDGTVTVSTNRRGYVLPLSVTQLRWNRMPRVKQLVDNGGGPRALIDAIFGLLYMNPIRGGKFAAVS